MNKISKSGIIRNNLKWILIGLVIIVGLIVGFYIKKMINNKEHFANELYLDPLIGNVYSYIYSKLTNDYEGMDNQLDDLGFKMYNDDLEIKKILDQLADGWDGNEGIISAFKKQEGVIPSDNIKRMDNLKNFLFDQIEKNNEIKNLYNKINTYKKEPGSPESYRRSLNRLRKNIANYMDILQKTGNTHTPRTIEEDSFIELPEAIPVLRSIYDKWIESGGPERISAIDYAKDNKNIQALLINFPYQILDTTSSYIQSRFNESKGIESFASKDDISKIIGLSELSPEKANSILDNLYNKWIQEGGPTKISVKEFIDKNKDIAGQLTSIIEGKEIQSSTSLEPSNSLQTSNSSPSCAPCAPCSPCPDPIDCRISQDCIENEICKESQYCKYSKYCPPPPICEKLLCNDKKIIITSILQNDFIPISSKYFNKNKKVESQTQANFNKNILPKLQRFMKTNEQKAVIDNKLKYIIANQKAPLKWFDQQGFKSLITDCI